MLFFFELIVDVFLIVKNLFLIQRLNAGDDPTTAFLLSSEAAVAGAESTINMQAQVDILADVCFCLSSL